NSFYHHLLFVSSVGLDKPQIKVIYYIRRSPIKVGGDSGHKSCYKGCQYNTHQTGGQISQHGGIGQIIIDGAVRNMRKCRFYITHFRENNQGGKSDNDPWPRSYSIMCNVEEKCGANGIFLIFG